MRRRARLGAVMRRHVLRHEVGVVRAERAAEVLFNRGVAHVVCKQRDTLLVSRPSLVKTSETSHKVLITVPPKVHFRKVARETQDVKFHAQRATQTLPCC